MLFFFFFCFVFFMETSIFLCNILKASEICNVNYYMYVRICKYTEKCQKWRAFCKHLNLRFR